MFLHKIYLTFQKFFVYILYAKLSWRSSFDFVYKMYTKVCRNMVYIFVYILYTFCIYQLYKSCAIFVYKMYTQFPCGRILYFPCYIEVSLNFKLERIKKKKRFQKFFQSILCRMDKWNLFLSANVHLFDVFTILIHHFVLSFSILSQNEKYYVKRKNKTQSSCMISFVFHVGRTYILRGALFIKVESQ